VVPTLIAVLAAAAYAAISLWLGDFFPFSRYGMYHDLTTRDEGAVLYVSLAGRFIAPEELGAVHGLDLAAIDPKRFPCSQQWLVYEAQRWLGNHSVTAAPTTGEPLEIGYRMLRVDGSGKISVRLQPVTQGTGLLADGSTTP
jgi:hypothetical protein